MNKACTKGKTRLKKDEQQKKSGTSEQGSDKSLFSNNTTETCAARLHYGHESRDAHQGQELGCGDVLELPLCSQEPLLDSSQDVSSQREVRWDCQSPETVRKLKKCRGQYSSYEVRNIVANFSDVPNDPLLHQSGRLDVPSKDAVTLARSSRLPEEKEKEKVTRKHKQRTQNKDSVQRMINLFHDQAVQPKTDFTEQNKRLCEASISHLNDEHDRSNNGINPVLSQVDGDDDYWSDDDLFQDSSFLIEVTQNPEKFLNAPQVVALVPKQCISELLQKQISGPIPEHSLISCSGLQIDESLAKEGLLEDSFSIPPSCNATKQTLLVGSKVSSALSHSSLSSNPTAKNVNKFKNFKRLDLYSNCTSSSTMSVGHTNKHNHTKDTTYPADDSEFGITTCGLHNGTAVSKSHSCKNAKSTSLDKLVIQSSQSAFMNPPLGATYKTSFRKFNSFQVHGSSTENTNNNDGTMQKPNLNSSFRKTLSFDSSLSTNTATSGLCRIDTVSAPDFFELLAKPETNFKSEQKEAAKSGLAQLQLQTEKVFINSTTQDDGFDVSLSDEILLEVDEILNSQADSVCTTTTTVRPHFCDKNTLLPNKESSTGSEVSGMVRAKLKTSTLNTPIVTTKASSSTLLNAFEKKGNFVLDDHKTNSRQLNISKRTETLLSPVRSVANLQKRQRIGKNSPTQAYFQKTFSLEGDSPHRRRLEKHIRQSLPSSSTPIKHSMTDVKSCSEGQDVASVKDTSASFMDSVFDDSFTNDVALFESQILPVLEKLEAEALSTQDEPSGSLKCSSQEIEQKRQAALQKRSIKLSQTNIDHSRR